jgi:hypothetical protein
MTVRNQNMILEEINRRLNSGKACYHSFQNLLFSCLLSRNIKIRIYKIIILPVVVYGCETWPLTLREEHKLRMKNVIFWDVLTCGSCRNRRFGGTYRFRLQGKNNEL